MASTWTTESGKAVWDGRGLAAWLPDVVAQLAIAFDPAEIWLYGSVARGDDNGDSDIDLLVVLDEYDPTHATELKTMALRSVPGPVPFDVSFTDRGRFDRRSVVPGTVERAAQREGRRVHVRDELLGDHDAIRELVEAEAAVVAGDVVRGVEAVRALRTSPGS